MDKTLFVRLQPDRTVSPLSRRFGFCYTAHMYSIKCDLLRRLDKECPMVQTQPPKLLEQVREAIRTRHYSLRTEDTYLSWIKRFILFHGKRHPRDMGLQEVQQFLSHLAVAGHVAASTQSQALSAILFLYQQVLKQDIGWLHDIVRAKQPQRLPVVLTQDEVAKVLRQLSGVTWIMGTLGMASK